MAQGRCVFCGEFLKPEVTAKGEEIAHCMHIDTIELSPSQFDQPQVFRGLWLCHKCYSTMLFNIAANCKDYNIGPGI